MNDFIKQSARAAVNVAIKNGTLVRPLACSKCGIIDNISLDGRAVIHAHHYKGYEFPLDVEWLCVKCHFKIDKRKSGEENGRAKLTWDEVNKIRELFEKEQYGKRQLARQFDVSDRTIARILRNEIWKIDAALKE